WVPGGGEGGRSSNLFIPARHRSRGSDRDMKKRHYHKTLEELTKKNVEAIAMMEAEANAHRSIGDRVADAFATIVGSWPFIIFQSVLLAFWVALNVVA